jgi:hypothetical protein
VTAGLIAVVAASAGAIPVAGVLLLIVVGLMTDARRWTGLAQQSRIGARSEDEVRRALAGLEAEGWRLRHSLPYRGRGDIDSVAIAPTGVTFAVETKTRTFDGRHLAGVREMALWLYRRRRRWCRRGALPVLCVVRARVWSVSRAGFSSFPLTVSCQRCGLPPDRRSARGSWPARETFTRAEARGRWSGRRGEPVLWASSLARRAATRCSMRRMDSISSSMPSGISASSPGIDSSLADGLAGDRDRRRDARR